MEKGKETRLRDIEKNFDKVTIFKNDADFFYLYKKTEKIASAIYLITNFFSPQEPIKWSLRQAGLDLLKDMLTLANISLADKDQTIRAISTTVFNTLSLLEIGHRGGFISDMNYSILKDEFYAIIALIQDREKEQVRVDGVAFDTSYFHIDKNTETSAPRTSQVSPQKIVLYKGHDVLNQISPMHMAHLGGNTGSQANTGSPQTQQQIQDKSEDRQKQIVDYLKVHKEISIKDVARVIQGCSEKTIQRDLATLITKGEVKKVGERRWSKYLLNTTA
jgi:hypothetical protein